MLSAKEILLRAKKNVFTSRASENISKMRGDGLDFCEIRPYQAGDDIRKINFSASAKSGELQTNIFNESRQINTIIVVILSSSLFFGSKKLKIETLTQVVATLGYSSLKQQNYSKIIVFNGENKHSFQLKNEGDLLNVLQFILNTDLLKINENFNTMHNALIRENKSLMFIISDFYTINEYGSFAHKHQLNAIIVRDKLEEMPNFGEELSLISPQNNRSVDINIGKKTAKKYQTKLAKHDSKILSHLQKHKITFGKIFTCEDVFLRLNAILN